MSQKGFTLIEMMIVVAILALVAAIAIPNYRASQNRALEASVKSNMHVFQLAAEDFRVRNEHHYALDASEIAPLLSEDLRNPFDRGRGENEAWENRSSMIASPGPRVGIVSYADSGSGANYNIKGRGARNALSLVLVASLPDVNGSGSGTPVDTTTYTPVERRRSN